MPFSQLVKLFGRVSQILINLVGGGAESAIFWTEKILFIKILYQFFDNFSFCCCCCFFSLIVPANKFVNQLSSVY